MLVSAYFPVPANVLYCAPQRQATQQHKNLIKLTAAGYTQPSMHDMITIGFENQTKKSKTKPDFSIIIIIIIIIIIYPLTARVVGAQQMISQTVSSIFPCSSLPSGTWRTQGLSIP